MFNPLVFTTSLLFSFPAPPFLHALTTAPLSPGTVPQGWLVTLQMETKGTSVAENESTITMANVTLFVVVCVFRPLTFFFLISMMLSIRETA